MKGALDSALRHHAFDLEALEAEAIGGSIGSVVGERAAEDINSDYRASFRASYGRASASENYVTHVSYQQRASSTLRNTSTAHASSGNDATSSYGAATQAKNQQQAKKLNQFGLFGGGDQTPNQAQNSEQQFKTMLQKMEFVQAKNGWGNSATAQPQTVQRESILHAFNSSANSNIRAYGNALKWSMAHPGQFYLNSLNGPVQLHMAEQVAVDLFTGQLAMHTAIHTGNFIPLAHYLGGMVAQADMALLGTAIGTGVGASLGRFGIFESEVSKNIPVEFNANAKLISTHDFYNPGMLDDLNASNFIGSKYSTYLLKDDYILYRGGSSNTPLGQYMTFEKPDSELQLRIDKAILPNWPTGGSSVIDTGHAIRIPAGTYVHIGEVAQQGGIFLGGAQQIFIEKPWLIPGVEPVYSYPLQEELLWNKLAMTK